jgi:hypothetical protein
MDQQLQFQFTSLNYQTDVRTSRVAKIRSGLKCVLTPSERRIEKKKKNHTHIEWRDSLAAPYRL